MFMKAIYVIFFFGLLSSAYGDTLKPFASDGCSAFPDGTIEQKQLWLSCCIAHDKAYWQGGTYEQRKTADLALQQCVASVGHPNIAQLMLAGVRVGGSPYFPTAFRWGYGWPYLRGYRPLSDDELKQVEIMTRNMIHIIDK